MLRCRAFPGGRIEPKQLAGLLSVALTFVAPNSIGRSLWGNRWFGIHSSSFACLGNLHLNHLARLTLSIILQSGNYYNNIHSGLPAGQSN